MDLFISIGLFLLLLSGCSTQPIANQKSSLTNLPTAQQELAAYKSQLKKKKATIPAMVLPPLYQPISIFDNKKITFSAKNADLHQVLYSVAKIAGLNIIIDSDISDDLPVTLSVQDANLHDVLDIIMNISGCYYTLDGNILHVKQFMRKRFLIPYVHSSTSFNTQLGGDTLGSASSGSSSSGGSSSQQGINGIYTLNYTNPKGSNDFYTNLEANVKDLLSKQGTYTLNKFSGVLSVYDKKRNVMAIQNVLNDIQKASNKGVLIEAKVLEVTLNHGHQLGVNWNAVIDNVANSANPLKLSQNLALNGAVAGTMSYNSKNFQAVINALNSAGDVETVSNPRIKVLSGQSAIISSGKLVPFWEKEVQTDQGTGGSASNTQVTYNRRDILDGITMGVTPTIMKNGKIMLNVTPITSSIEKIIQHYDEKGASVASAPILNIKEAGTIITAKNNDLVLIGGLISNTTKKENESIPLLGSIPWIGSLFSRTNNVLEKKELVILIRVQVVQ